MSERKQLMRAITMQQPFAAAMVHGKGVFTRRGKPTKFRGEEWIAVHCGSNKEHLKNAKLMAEIRKEWPECPSDEELLKGQKCILGMARFVDGNVSTSDASVKNDFYLQRYDCSKPVAWRSDKSMALKTPLNYPKGQLQVWYVYEDAFPDKNSSVLMDLLNSTAPETKQVKEEQTVKEEDQETKQTVKKEGTKKRASVKKEKQERQQPTRSSKRVKRE